MSPKRNSGISDEHHGRGRAVAHFKRVHHSSNHEAPGMYAESFTTGGRVRRAPGTPGASASIPLLHQTVPLKIYDGAHVFFSSLPSYPTSHLGCCFSESTLGLPWAGCCLHISCGVCGFPGAKGLHCMLMHWPALTQQALEHA